MKPECIYISGFTHKEDTLTPHGFPSMECGGTYPDSGSSQLAHLTNKHNHHSRI